MLFSVIYFILIAMFHYVNSFVFDIKPHETGRYVWKNHNQNLRFFCAYCTRDVFLNSNKYERYRVNECYHNNTKRLTESEKTNQHFPYCNENGGEIPSCGSLPLVDGGRWKCQTGVSSKSVWVYSKCTLQCDKQNQKISIIKSIRCNESLTWDEDISSFSCLEDIVTTASTTTTTTTTTTTVQSQTSPEIVLRGGCALPQNLSGEPWKCDRLDHDQLMDIGTKCRLDCPNKNINITAVCQEKDLHPDWSRNISNVRCDDGFYSQQSYYLIIFSVIIIMIIIVTIVICCVLRHRRRKSKNTSRSPETERFLKQSPQNGTAAGIELKLVNCPNTNTVSTSEPENCCSTNSASASNVDSEDVSETSCSIVMDERPPEGTNSVNKSIAGKTDIKADNIVSSDLSSTGKQDVVHLPVDQLGKDKSLDTSNSGTVLYTGSLGEENLDKCPLSTISDRKSVKDEMNPKTTKTYDLSSKELEEMENGWDESLTGGLEDYAISDDDKKFQFHKNIPGKYDDKKFQSHKNIPEYDDKKFESGEKRPGKYNDKKFESDKKIPGKYDGEKVESDDKIPRKVKCYKPTIVEKNKLLVCKLGKDFQINISATGHPEPEFTWELRKLDGKLEILQAFTVHQNTGGNKYVQMVKCEKSTLEDMGEYKVTVSNVHGSSTVVTTVCHQDCNETVGDFEAWRYQFITELAKHIEPLHAIKEEKSWKGLARWIGIDDNGIKLEEFHTTGRKFEATKYILECLKHRGYTLGHLIFYFSLEESFQVDVIKLIQAYFSDHCNECPICSMLLSIQEWNVNRCNNNVKAS